MDGQLVKELKDTVRPAVEELVSLAAERGLCAVEICQDGLEIRVERLPGAIDTALQPVTDVPPALDEHHRMVPVLSTLVGVFRLRPAPEKDPAATVDADIEAGHVLGYVESMGLTYEVHAPVAGRLAEIIVEEGHPVEYGQPLMVLEAAE